MFYLLMRVCFVILLVIISFLIIKIFHVKMTKQKTSILLFIIIVLGCFLYYFPIESSFIRFNNLEDAVQYSSYNTNILKTIRADKSDFVITGSNIYDVTYLSVIKKEGKWKLPERKIKTTVFPIKIQQLDDGNITYSFNLLTNTNTNESILFVDEIITNEIHPELSVKDMEENEMDVYFRETNFIGFYKIFENDVPENYFIYLGNSKHFLDI